MLTETRFKPGWLMKDVQRATERLGGRSMAETPKDRAALLELQAKAAYERWFAPQNATDDELIPWEKVPEPVRQGWRNGQEAALGAAEDVGVSMQPDEPTTEQIEGGLTADYGKTLLDRIVNCAKAVYDASPYQRRKDG